MALYGIIPSVDAPHHHHLETNGVYATCWHVDLEAIIFINVSSILGEDEIVHTATLVRETTDDGERNRRRRCHVPYGYA